MYCTGVCCMQLNSICFLVLFSLLSRGKIPSMLINELIWRQGEKWNSPNETNNDNFTRFDTHSRGPKWRCGGPRDRSGDPSGTHAAASLPHSHNAKQRLFCQSFKTSSPYPPPSQSLWIIFINIISPGSSIIRNSHPPPLTLITLSITLNHIFRLFITHNFTPQPIHSVIHFHPPTHPLSQSLWRYTIQSDREVVGKNIFRLQVKTSSCNKHRSKSLHNLTQ